VRSDSTSASNVLRISSGDLSRSWKSDDIHSVGPLMSNMLPRR